MLPKDTLEIWNVSIFIQIAIRLVTNFRCFINVNCSEGGQDHVHRNGCYFPISGCMLNIIIYRSFFAIRMYEIVLRLPVYD